MLTLYRITILIFFLPLLGIGQKHSKAIDSLINIYETTTSDQQKLQVGQNLSDSLLRSDRILAKKYGLETFPLARVSEDPLLKAYGYFLVHLFNKRDADSEHFNEFAYLDSAEVVLRGSYEGIDAKDANLLQIIIHRARGTNFYNKGEMLKAVECYQKALTIAKEQDLKKYVAYTYYGIATCHFALDNYDESIRQLKITYDYSVKNEIPSTEAYALNILGATYQQLDSFAQAKIYVAKALTLAEQSKDEQMYREVLMNMGLVVEELEELDSALYYMELSLENTIGRDDVLIEAQIYSNMARVESKRGNSEEARRLFKLATQLNSNIDRKEIDYKLAIDIAGMEYRDKNYQAAYDLLEEGYFKKDSFTSLESRTSLAELELKYGKAEDEKKIVGQELALVKKERRIAYLTGAFLFSFLGFLIFYAFYRNSKNAKELVQKELDLKKIEIVSMEKEKSILALSSTLEGQEAERSRIAQDLHDGLGGLLSAVKAHYGKIQKEIKKLESMDVFNAAEGMLDNACEEVRRISHNLMPPLLRSYGLIPAFQGLVNNYQSPVLEVQLDSRNMDQRLTETQEVFIYRIAQELLSNIRKHASASKIEISLYGLENEIQLIVEDNGIGFSTDDINPGLGLESIKSRVGYLHGEFDIESEPGHGTSISISIPRT